MKTNKIIVGLVVVLVAAIGAGAYLWHHNNNAPASLSQQTQQVSYQIQNSYYTSTATPAGERVSFKKPAELTPLTTSYTNEITLAQTQNNAYDAYIAEDFVAAQPALTYQQLSTALADTSNPAYQTSLEGVKAFISRRFIASYDISYQKAKPFTNQAINANAWQLDFTAIKNSGNKFDNGRVVYAVSSKGQYYFAVVAPDYNWQSNLNTWNQVFTSLKIDQ